VLAVVYAIHERAAKSQNSAVRKDEYDYEHEHEYEYEQVVTVHLDTPVLPGYNIRDLQGGLDAYYFRSP